MSTSPHSPVPVALGSGSGTDEENRAFLQQRLGVFGGWVFVISGGFFLVGLVGSLAAPDQASLFSANNLFHALATLTVGAVWVVARGRPRAMPTLEWIDAASVTLACLFFGLMGGAMAPMMLDTGHDLTQGLTEAFLACIHTVITRAIAVPSITRRTVWISVAALAPLPLLVAPYTLRTAGLDLSLVVEFAFGMAAWVAAATTVAAVGSRIIFGLRTEAAKVKRLGQYTLEEKIGEGGMGVVYRARHVMLRRPTAIKLLPPEKAGEESLRRFEREVQLTAQLTHPSTVSIFDYGRTPLGIFYYAMELLDGLNLAQLVTRDGPQPDGRVVRILTQVCGALAEAHGVGLIHRDIKPANIILSVRGGVADVATVVDFGLVKQLDPGDGDLTQAVTASNVVTGTPLYVAPEVIKGDSAADARSDLYAVGAVGYYLLTGLPVFEAKTVVEIFAHHLHTPPHHRATARPGRFRLRWRPSSWRVSRKTRPTDRAMRAPSPICWLPVTVATGMRRWRPSGGSATVSSRGPQPYRQTTWRKVCQQWMSTWSVDGNPPPSGGPGNLRHLPDGDFRQCGSLSQLGSGTGWMVTRLRMRPTMLEISPDYGICRNHRPRWTHCVNLRVQNQEVGNEQGSEGIRRKKRVLEHAARIGNVRKTCRYFGVARSGFYVWKKAFESHGDEGQHKQDRAGRRSHHASPGEPILPRTLIWLMPPSPRREVTS